MPWSHVVLILYELLLVGSFQSALGLLVMFTAYLRPSELLLLSWGDLIRPTRAQHHYALLLHPEEKGVPSKTGQFGDGVQLDSSLVPWLGKLLGRLAQNREEDEKLIDVTYLQLKKDMEAAMEKLKLGDASLYRLRHGGASEDRARSLRTLEEIKKRGRWTSDNSVRRYEKSVRLQREEGRLSGEMLARASALEIRLPQLFGA